MAEHKTDGQLNINCVDPLNRSALIAAIENENIELIRILLEADIKVTSNSNENESIAKLNDLIFFKGE